MYVQTHQEAQSDDELLEGSSAFGENEGKDMNEDGNDNDDSDWASDSDFEL